MEKYAIFKNLVFKEMFLLKTTVYLNIFFKIDNITLGSGSKLCQFSGSETKYNVFGFTLLILIIMNLNLKGLECCLVRGDVIAIRDYR